jgi:hypothetical protein
VKFKLPDKLRSLELLGKHHALFTERHAHELGGVAQRLAAALARADERANDNARPARDPRGRARNTARMGPPAGDARKQARWAR